MKIKIDINSRLGSLLFSYETEENTIKKTLLEAIKHGADLSGADLRSANLSGADLRSADKCSFQSFGSLNRTTTAYKDGEAIKIVCGCFFGTLDEFITQVESHHGDNKHGKEYKAMIELIKIKFGI